MNASKITVCVRCAKELPTHTVLAGRGKLGWLCAKCWHVAYPTTDCASKECKRKGCGPIYL